MNYKKLLPILMAVVIAFSTVFAIPQKKAEAAVWGAAIPGGVVVGTGVYVTGALLLAAGAGAVGYDAHSEAINAHAKQVWNDGTQTAKDSIKWSVEQSIGAGTALTEVGGEYVSYLGGHIDTISSFMAGLNNPADNPSPFNVMTSFNQGRIVQLVESYLKRDGQAISLSANGEKVTSVSLVLNPWASYTAKVVNGPDGYPVETRVQLNIPNGSAAYQALMQRMSTVASVADAKTLLGSFGIGATLNVEQLNEYNNIRPRVQEAWESMRDAGLVMPVDNAFPYAPDGTAANYNPDTDVYTGIDGGVLNPADVSWRLPNLKWREKSDKIEVPGVYVDTPVITGNPAYDTPAADVPKTTTNIHTGTTVANPDFATSEPIEGGGTGEPPPPGSDWTRPPTKKPPNISGLIVTKFPFSLPWDFFGMLGWLEAEPKAPVFKVDSSMPNPFGKDMQFDFELKLNFLDDYIGFFRSFILIGFSLFLILATRRLLGGAS